MSDLPTARTAVSSGVSSLGQNQWQSLKQRGSKLFFDGFRTLTSRKVQGIDDKVRHPSTFAAFGPFDVRSTSDLVARRKGNKLYFTGNVRHGFDEETDREMKDRRALGDFTPKEENFYNFNEGAIGSGAAKNLEPVGAAKPLRMQYERLQELNAEAEYMPGGGLLLRSAK